MCDCDRPSAFSQGWRRARKAHRCCECRETIPAGSRYHYASGVWDGRGTSYKTCLDCAQARAFLLGRILRKTDCGPCFTQLWDDVLGEHRADVEFEIGRIFVAAVGMAALAR